MIFIQCRKIYCIKLFIRFIRYKALLTSYQKLLCMQSFPLKLWTWGYTEVGKISLQVGFLCPSSMAMISPYCCIYDPACQNLWDRSHVVNAPNICIILVYFGSELNAWILGILGGCQGLVEFALQFGRQRRLTFFNCDWIVCLNIEILAELGEA